MKLETTDHNHLFEPPGFSSAGFEQIAVAVFTDKMSAGGLDITPVQYAALEPCRPSQASTKPNCFASLLLVAAERTPLLKERHGGCENRLSSGDQESTSQECL